MPRSEQQVRRLINLCSLIASLAFFTKLNAIITLTLDQNIYFLLFFYPIDRVMYTHKKKSFMIPAQPNIALLRERTYPTRVVMSFFFL